MFMQTSNSPAAAPQPRPRRGGPGLQERSAVAMLAAGVALSVAGFLVPPVGEISDSVLWFFAQCLLYAGSIFGVTAYVDARLSRLLHRRGRRRPGAGEGA